MRVTSLLLLSLTTLSLAACGGEVKTYVYTDDGRKVGEIQLQDENNATIVNTYGEVRGKVRGNLVRDDTGARAGTVEVRDGMTVIVDAKGNDAGTVEKGMDCKGKGQAIVGRVNTDINVNAVGAACLLLLLPKE